MSKIKVDSKGNWMRSDAAMSYYRMVNAGMPRGGIDQFGRSIAEQWQRWRAYRAGRGNLAAYPNKFAPHVRGVAFDTHTTTGGKYSPSKAHTWLVKGGVGSDVNVGEHIKANEHGYVRTVNKGPRRERWHFAYNAARDKWKGKHAKYLKLQKALREAGCTLDCDGVFGHQTFVVLGKFQKDHDIAVTYIDGPETWSLLNQYSAH